MMQIETRPDGLALSCGGSRYGVRIRADDTAYLEVFEDEGPGIVLPLYAAPTIAMAMLAVASYAAKDVGGTAQRAADLIRQHSKGVS